MTTTFEDRLLAELRAEVERHEAPEPVSRRLVTARRAGLGLAAACAATAVTVFALPGSGTSSAYAVEQNPDGTVTVHLYELTLDRHEQGSLAADLRAAGVTVAVEQVPEGHVCQLSGDVQTAVGIAELETGGGDELPGPGEEGEHTEGSPRPGDPELPDSAHGIVMHPGDTLVIANRSASSDFSDFFFVAGSTGPCEMVPEGSGPAER